MAGVIRFLVVLGVLLLGAVSFLGVRTYVRAGEATTLVPAFDGTCARIEGLPGAEDIVVDRDADRAYAIGLDRAAAVRGETPDGAVAILSWPDGAVITPRAARTDADPLYTFGADLHIDAAGVRRLFIVDRADATAHRIVIYRIEGQRLVFERALAAPELVNPNDVVAIGPDAAFVTLDKRAPTGSLGEALEAALDLRTGKVVRIDPAGARVVADGLSYANGIALSADGRTLTVAETIGRSLAIYTRDLGTDALNLSDRVFLGTGVDNLAADPEGRLWIGAHPKLLTFTAHARDRKKDAPSQVIVVDPAAKSVDQAFLSLGADISGSSVAVADVAARRLWIGSVYEHHILACDLPEVWRHSESRPASRPVTRGG